MLTNPQDKLTPLLSAPRLTRQRIFMAMTIAVVADLLPWLLGPFGWAFLDEVIDVVAAVLLARTIGFHWLLLPSFVVELVPVVDMLPTWTACVAAVVALRKRKEVPIIDI